MQTSTIKFSQLEDRIDAEYYKPEYLEVASDLDRNKKVKFLGDIVNTIVNGVESRNYSVRGKPYLRVSDIKEMFMDLSNVKFIPEDFKFSKDIELLEGDILTSRSGTLGISAIAPKAGSIISSHLIRISPKKEINPYYLVTFLNSKYGRLQILQKNNGAVVPEINQPSLKSIKIFLPFQSFQQEIEKMVKKAQRKRKLADEKYKEAEEILNKELGLGDLDLSVQKTFETKFSEVQDRFDPEYYQPVFKKIEKLFKKQKVVNLGYITSEIKYGTSEDLFYTEKGIPFLRVTDINKFSNIEQTEGKFISGFDAKRLKEYQVKKDDIIISRTGTLGLAVYINEKLDGAIYGSYFIKVKPQHKDLSNRFIAFFISSKIGKLQTSRWASGGIQTNLTIDAIKSIQIPILSKSTQQKISSLIQESFKLHREAKELLEQTKQKVEELIEK